MFCTEIRKIMYTPVNPQFYYIKVGFKGFKGVQIIKVCFRDGEIRSEIKLKWDGHT